MNNGILGTKIVTQIGILVNNIEETANAYANFFGVDVPAIIVTDEMEKAQTEFRGTKSPARAKLAFFNVGDTLDIELIEPDNSPSTWRECLDKNGEGIHHIALVIEGMKEKIQLLDNMNMPLLQKGEYTGGRYAYIDASDELKVILELLENDK